MRIDYGGAVIPWYESPLAGGVNYTWQERPPEAPVQDKSSWGQGSGGGGIFGGFFENLDDAVNTLPGGWLLPAAVAVAVTTGYVDPSVFATEAGTTALATEGAATLTAAELATLTEASLAVDAAMAGAGGVGAGAGTVGATAFVGATETGLGTLAGEGAIGDVAGTTLLGEAGATGAAESAIGAELASEPLGTFQMGQGTSLSADASTNPLNPFYNTANPEVSANFNTVSNLVGGGAESNLTALNQLASNPLLPIGSGGIGSAELGSIGSILGTGEGLGQQTLGQVLAPTGLSGVSVQDLASDKPVYSSNLNTTDALRAANTLRKLLTTQKTQLTQQAQKTALQNAQNTQQQTNMANMLRGAQLPQTALPSIYKQANPFNFGQQNQPVQDTNALANLLRTA